MKLALRVSRMKRGTTALEVQTGECDADPRHCSRHRVDERTFAHDAGPSHGGRSSVDERTFTNDAGPSCCDRSSVGERTFTHDAAPSYCDRSSVGKRTFTNDAGPSHDGRSSVDERTFTHDAAPSHSGRSSVDERTCIGDPEQSYAGGTRDSVSSRATGESRFTDDVKCEYETEPVHAHEESRGTPGYMAKDVLQEERNDSILEDEERLSDTEGGDLCDLGLVKYTDGRPLRPSFSWSRIGLKRGTQGVGYGRPHRAYKSYERASVLVPRRSKVKTWLQPSMIAVVLLPLLIITATPIRQHWFRLLESQRSMDTFTDTLDMPVPTDVGITVSTSRAAAVEAAVTATVSGKVPPPEAAGRAAVDGDEIHCRSVFDAAMAGHNQLLQLSAKAQQALSRSFITQCEPTYLDARGESAAKPRDIGGLLAYRLWRVFNPYCWPFLKYNPVILVWDSLCNVGHCILIFLIIAVAATIFPSVAPLNLLVLQLDILILIYCYQVKETNDSLRLAVAQIVSADARLSTWEWPSSLSLAVYRSLLHQTLSNLDDMWEDTYLILELPWMPLLGRMELSPEAMMQVASTSAAACSMNLLAVIRPELSLYQLCKSSFSWAANGLTASPPARSLTRSLSKASRITKDSTLDEALDRAEKTPLYERLGGRAGIEGVVTNHMMRVSKDPQIGHFFEGTDPKLMVKHITHFLATAWRSSMSYDVQALRDIHLHMIVQMGLNTSHFDTFVGHLIGALADRGAIPEDQSEVMQQLANLRSAFRPANDLDALLYSWPSVGNKLVGAVIQAALEQKLFEKQAGPEEPVSPCSLTPRPSVQSPSTGSRMARLSLENAPFRKPLSKLLIGSVKRTSGSTYMQAARELQAVLDDAEGCEKVGRALYNLLRAGQPGEASLNAAKSVGSTAHALRSRGFDVTVFDTLVDAAHSVFEETFQNQGEALLAAGVKTLTSLRNMLQFSWA